MAERNKNNFLRWSDSNTDTTLFPISQLFEKGLKCSQPILVPGEVTSFYFNDSAKTVNSGSIHLVDLTNQIVSSNIGTCTAFTVVGGRHATGAVTCPSVPSGYYKLFMVNGGLYSNIVEVLTDSELKLETGYFEFYDTRAIIDFLYPYAPGGFKQKFRLRYDRTGNNYFVDAERQIFINGNEKSISQRGYKYFKLKIVETDEALRDAIMVMLSNGNLQINGLTYTFKPDGGINVPTEGDSLSNMEFELMFEPYRITC